MVARATLHRKLPGKGQAVRQLSWNLSIMILVRHGQSEFNVVYSVTRVDPGIPDPKLTDEGRRQARDIAVLLAPHGLRRILVSPYTRALETAEIIASALNLDLRVEPLVREHCRFHCDIGSPRSALAQRWPAIDFAHLPERWWPDLDESEEELAERSQGFRQSMAQDRDWPATAVVTHWGFIRALTGQRVPNAHLLRFDPHSGQASDLAPVAVP
jgi:broad specificity phosphatase PhoE